MIRCRSYLDERMALHSIQLLAVVETGVQKTVIHHIIGFVSILLDKCYKYSL
jgi:hypothetical protein